jgi:hypothetical protein
MSYKPTSKDIEERIFERGGTKESENEYTVYKGNGSYDRITTDGDWYQSSDNGYDWRKK